MANITDHIQTADWKSEKHVPVIECPDEVAAGEAFEVKLSVGKEIAHPNTTEHHIRWISLYFHPQGEKFMFQVAKMEFLAHGESTKGANQGPVYGDPVGSVTVKIDSPGHLHALAYCNIHGVWGNSIDLKVK